MTPPPSARPPARLAPALTILLSSFLLFLVQPILAKQVLPWFGGASGVWTMCLLFFQFVLLLGYAYAHVLTHRGGARQYGIHMALVLASLAALPIIPAAHWRNATGIAPEWQIAGVLATTVGLPYFLLSSTGPLLQKWLSEGAASDPSTASVYRLFALSNFGSLLGLLSYPFAIEPFVSVRVQAWTWSVGYGLFAAATLAYAGRCWRARPASRSVTAPAGVAVGKPDGRAYAYWIGCSALGSILLLAGTNQLTQNVASMPLLWIVPLTLYLGSFTLCFDGRGGRGWYERRYWLTPAMGATGAMAWALYADHGTLSFYVALPVFVVGLFLGFMLCHGELARSKPAPAQLTQFYLSVSTGGALGGLLVGLVAPQLFSGYWETPLALIALAALGSYCCVAETKGAQSRPAWAVAAIAIALASVILLLLGAVFLTSSDWSKVVEGNAVWGLAALLVGTAIYLQRRHYWRAIPLAALLCTTGFAWTYYQNMQLDARESLRNFYGALTVTESSQWPVRWLKHGVIMHGSQATTPSQRLQPTTYYGSTSGVGRAIRAQREALGRLNIGAVGLGVGTLAAYGRPGDVLRIYELNPAVLDIARRQFSYLSDTPAAVAPVLGDGRLSLEHELAAGQFSRPEALFDVLVLDAFSGDAVPMHLLTREAFATYARVTKPGGVIAFHVSNRYLDLAPIIGQVSRTAGYASVLVSDRPAGQSALLPSDWVLAALPANALHAPAIGAAATPIEARPGLRLWTDDFTSAIWILK